MRLIAAAEKAEVPLLIGHHRRYSELMARTRELLDSGLLGQLVAVQGSALFYKPDRYTMRLRTYPGERSWWLPFDTATVDVGQADPLARQLEHFCAVIRGEAQPRVTGRDAVQTLKATLAVSEAARTGRNVSIS